MRRFACAVLPMFCGLLACIAAQSLQVERFDKSGLPTRPQTSVERDLARRISAHRAGDVADAVRIQRQLAAYYQGKGDYARARAAEARAIEAAEAGEDPMNPRPYGTAPRRDGVAAPPYPRTYRGAPMPVYAPMPVPAPAQAEPAPPAFGNVASPAPPAPGSVAVPAYDPGDAKPAEPAPQPPDAKAIAPKNDDAGAPQPVAVSPQLSGRFSGMQGQTLHTWEFRPDGSFEHAWTARVPATGDANLEAGTFSVVGPYLTLVVWGRAGTRSAAPARGAQQVRRHRIGMLGPGAGNAIMLDGMMLKPQNVE